MFVAAASAASVANTSRNLMIVFLACMIFVPRIELDMSSTNAVR